MHHCLELVIFCPSELAEHKSLHLALSAKEDLSILSPFESHVIGRFARSGGLEATTLLMPGYHLKYINIIKPFPTHVLALLCENDRVRNVA